MRVYYSDLIQESVDLDYILSIADAYFIDKMGFGGWSVGFYIRFTGGLKGHEGKAYFQFDLNEDDEMRHAVPTKLQVPPTHSSCIKERYPQLSYITDDGTIEWVANVGGWPSNEHKRNSVAIRNLQKRIDELIKEWSKGTK